MQGKEQERIVRVLLAPESEAPDPGLFAQHPGLVVAQVGEAARSALPGGAGAIYLIDPLGNLVLRYGADPDIKGISKDLTRLLKASGIG
jgi:hypothetical protein